MKVAITALENEINRLNLRRQLIQDEMESLVAKTVQFRISLAELDKQIAEISMAINRLK